MINESALRDALPALAQQSRMLYELLSAVLNEVAALRDTVQGLDPTFSDVMEQKRIESALKQAQFVKLQLALFDQIIEQLKNDVVY
jgi:hypothetical protein